MFTKTTIGLFVFAATLAPWPMVAHSQTVYWAPPGPPVAATPQISVALSPQQVNQLAAPIALYPDPLLAEMLPASTYPLEVVEAARWLAAYPNPSGIMIDLQTWDPSVKALLHYPTVLGYMSDNLAWTEALGVAFLNQQQDVMQAIQQLRALALAAGTLQTTAQQQIILQGGDIYIEPVNPQLLYVPEYNPNVVYSAPAVGIPAGLSLLVSFSRGWQIGAWLDNDCDWDHHWVNAGGDWRHRWANQAILRRNWSQQRRQVQRFMRQRARPPAWSSRQVPRGRFPPGPEGGRGWPPPAFVRSTPWARNPARPLPALPPTMIRQAPLQQYRGWILPAPGRVAPGVPRFRRPAVPPANRLFGHYRGNVRVQREAARGWQSLSRTRLAVPRSPPAFRGISRGRQQRQASARGRASMRRRR